MCAMVFNVLQALLETSGLCIFVFVVATNVPPMVVLAVMPGMECIDVHLALPIIGNNRCVKFYSIPSELEPIKYACIRRTYMTNSLSLRNGLRIFS